MTELQNKVIDFSKKNGLSHIGSCITAVDIIDKIYEKKKPEDIFCLSSGHAGVALYLVLEKYGLANAQECLDKYGIHPCKDAHIPISTGSLGLGFPIALGFAVARPKSKVYILCSDGEAAEGSFWEALNYSSFLSNVEIHVNINGWGAYCKIDINKLKKQLLAFNPNTIIHKTNSDFNGIAGLDAHYKVLQ